ncbi:small acid-soluble spore protein SspI [Paenibacillus sp. FA6]|uniref:small acid-soluble spore protein SspI n=1 Tax=Paenibacillus sp. FA6 TaxID=3413029 RepID=UPI003F6556F8
MPIALDLRQAIIHKVHNKNDAELREMIEGSVDGPEAALPGLGAIFEMIWKNIEPAQQDELIQVAQKHLQTVTPAPLL